MDGVVEAAVAALGLQGNVDHLVEGARQSESFIADASSFLTTAVDPSPDDLDVLLFGSIARREASGTSDFDFLVVAHRLPDIVIRTRELITNGREAARQLHLDPPGASGIFGTVISAPDLTERIGLEQDTNVTLSRRILLLQESVSIYRPALREHLMRAVLERYLVENRSSEKVPRFLLNDLLRYWRTIAVDYQAKRWEKHGASGWGLRYLKLIISRKLAFVGTLIPLFICEDATTNYFLDQFNMPSLARICQLHALLEERFLSDLRIIIEVAEEFAGSLADEDFRREADSITSRREITPGSPFHDMQERSRELQRSLESIFFDSDLMKQQSRKYLSF